MTRQLHFHQVSWRERERERERFFSLGTEFGDWSSEEISCLKEGLRKYGRAWGKIYREVGGLKTATQCKQFYDKHYTNKELELTAALEEHSFLKVNLALKEFNVL